VPKKPTSISATGKTGASIPLFYRKRTGPQGEVDEISFGPCGVNVVRCFVALILGILLIVNGGIAPSIVLRLLLKLLRAVL
jgi:hypothetical protein